MSAFTMTAKRAAQQNEARFLRLPTISRRDRVSHASGMPAQSEGGTVMSIIGWIILGLLAGFIASKIVNREGEGFFLDIGLGVIGAVVGG
jgi:hypothetical protein